jgi:hypothetical protein
MAFNLLVGFDLLRRQPLYPSELQAHAKYSVILCPCAVKRDEEK